MVMKVGVISDTHLREVTPSLRRICDHHLDGLDALLHAGDVVSVEVIRFLDRGAFFGVHGNMDPPEVRDLLPGSRVVELNGFRIGLTHGWSGAATRDELEGGIFSDVDVVVHGHTHTPANRVRDGILFFNPGTATGHCRAGANTLGILELGERVIGRIVEIQEIR